MDWTGILVICAIVYCVIRYSYSTHELNKE